MSNPKVIYKPAKKIYPAVDWKFWLFYVAMLFIIFVASRKSSANTYNADYDYNSDNLINYRDFVIDANDLAGLAAHWCGVNAGYGGDVPTATSFTQSPVAVVAEAQKVILLGDDDMFGGQLRYVITAISPELVVQADVVGAIPIEPNDLPYTIPAYGNELYVWASETGTFTIKYKAVNIDQSSVATITFSAVGGDENKLEFTGQGYVLVPDSELDGNRPTSVLGFTCWFRTNSPRGIIFKKGNIEFGLTNGRLYGKLGDNRAITRRRFDNGRWHIAGLLITPQWASVYNADPNSQHFYESEYNLTGSGNYGIEISATVDDKDKYLGESGDFYGSTQTDMRVLLFGWAGDIDNSEDIKLGYTWQGSIDRAMFVNAFDMQADMMFRPTWRQNTRWYSLPGRNAITYGALGFDGVIPQVEYRWTEEGLIFKNAISGADPNAYSSNHENVKKKMIRTHEKVRLLPTY